STQNDKEQLTWLKERLSDDESKKCLDDIIAFRSSPSSESYVENDWQTQYFPPWLLKLPLWKKGINFIDCGSYIGDTLASAAQVLKEADIQLNTMQCFEPDPKNFHLLNKTAKELVSQGIKTYLFPCGVWEENTILSFSADLSQGKFADSQQITDNNLLLPVIALDDTSIASAVNFIKMDIEGAEPHALKGAKEIITHQSPLLAISVYHEPAHLWQIAQQIESYNPNYEYKLHCHGDFGLEIILYAIPK
ncbi:MAG: FkbM family methyltransferase, partial [Pseudomonadota bacterium]